MGLSRLQVVATLPRPERRAWLAHLTEDEREAIAQQYWELIARPEQLAPLGEWSDWWLIAGRRYGKTRAGAEWIHERVRKGLLGHGVLVGATAADVRDIQIDGPSGLLQTARRGEAPHHEPSKRRVTFHNGATVTTFSAEDPEALRGHEWDSAWCDEPGKWRYGKETRDNLKLGGSAGDPRIVWTTTPRSVPIVREAIGTARKQQQQCRDFGGFEVRDPRSQSGTRWRTEPNVRLTHGTTYENLINLAPAYAEEILNQYEGKRIGRQELHAELLEDLGSFFMRGWFGYAEDEASLPRIAQVVRYWDLAATIESEGNTDPDWTAGAKVARHVDNTYTILDVRRARVAAGGVEQFILETAAGTDTAEGDGRNVPIGIEQEGGSAGKLLVGHYKTDVLAGWQVQGYRPTGPKAARASMWAGLAEQGRLRVLRAPWNDMFLDECEEFRPDEKHDHDDMVDAVSGAFTMLQGSGPVSWTSPADVRL